LKPAIQWHATGKGRSHHHDSFSSNYGFQKVLSTKKSSLDFIETFPNEKELIKKYVDTIQSEDPEYYSGI